MRVKDVCEVNSKSLPADVKWDYYLYLDTSNITENMIDEIQKYEKKDDLPSRAKRIVEAGDIIISTVRPIQKHFGYLEKPKENLLVSTGFTVLSPKKDLVNEKYLYYYLTRNKVTDYFQLIAESSVTSYPSITSDIIANFKIQLPEKKIQDKLVDTIWNYDEKIFNNMRIIELLENYLQSLLYKWFVEFNFPDKNGQPYKNAGGEMYTKDGKIIPIGWEKKKIGEWRDIQIIKSGVDKFEGEKRYITTSDVVGTNINTKVENVTYKNRTSRANMQPELNSVWFAKMQDTSKKIFITDKDFIDTYLLSTGFAGFRCKRNTFSYIAAWVNSVSFEKLKNQRCNGSTQKAINDTGIKSIPVVVPADKVLEKFETKTYNIYKKLNIIQKENEILKEVRNLLILKNIN